jgi:hypothetical protein
VSRNERNRFIDNAKKDNNKEVKAASALHSAAQPQDSVQDGAAAKTPPSSNLKSCGKFGELLKCEGCGNIWNRDRPIPCSSTCRYSEHPEFNREWRIKPYSRRSFLTWKGFRERFPHIKQMPPGLLDWEAKQKAYQMRKRSATEHADQPASKKA